MPAHRRDLMEIANGEKLPGLRTVIFCTEDAVSHADVDSSLRHLGLCLQGFRPTVQRYRFIRARNPEILSRLLDLPHIEKVDGFVLPKFNSDVFHAYFDQLHGTPFTIMPTLETRDVFDHGAMQELRQALAQPAIFKQLLMLRIGGNDLMNLLGMRRTRGLTLYDTPLGNIIACLVTVFKPYGFALSAPVFDYLDDDVTLQKELRLDLAYGLSGKTAIHPDQVPQIEAAYQVAPEDAEMALKLLDISAPAVFKMHNAMCEVATHKKWAKDIIDRQICYGIKESVARADCSELSV
jgi:citrate lyase beta subunit